MQSMALKTQDDDAKNAKQNANQQHQSTGKLCSVQAIMPTTFKIQGDHVATPMPMWNSYEIFAVESPSIVPGQYLRFPPSEPEAHSGIRLNAAGRPTKRGRQRVLSGNALRAAALLRDIQNGEDAPLDPDSTLLLYQAIKNDEKKSSGFCSLWNSNRQGTTQEKAIQMLVEFKNKLKLQKLLIDEQAEKLNGAYDSIKSQHMMLSRQEEEFHRASAHLQSEIRHLIQDNQLLEQERTAVGHALQDVRRNVLDLSSAFSGVSHPISENIKSRFQSICRQLETALNFRLCASLHVKVEDPPTAHVKPDVPSEKPKKKKAKKKPRKPLRRRKVKKVVLRKKKIQSDGVKKKKNIKKIKAQPAATGQKKVLKKKVAMRKVKVIGSK